MLNTQRCTRVGPTVVQYLRVVVALILSDSDSPTHKYLRVISSQRRHIFFIPYPSLVPVHINLTGFNANPNCISQGFSRTACSTHLQKPANIDKN